MSLRALLTAPLVVGAVLFGLARAAAPAHAQIPNRLYGTVTLNGAPAPVGTPIVALTNGKTCASTTVQRLDVGGTSSAPLYPYVLDVPAQGADPICKPGAVVTFTVGGVTAGQTFTLDDLATFNRIDLTAPGTPNVPSQNQTVNLAAGCTDVTSTFPNGTTPATIAAAVSPASALAAIWRYDAASGHHQGYSPATDWASDLTSVAQGDKLRICTSAAATLTQPAA